MSKGSIRRLICLSIAAFFLATLANTRAADPKAPVVVGNKGKIARIPAVLASVPTSAAAVIVAPNMAALEGKLALLTRTVGIPFPPLQSVVEQIKQLTQLENAKGIDGKGSVALVFGDVTAVLGGVGGAAGHSSVVLMPVNDYQTFVTSVGGKASEKVTAVKLKAGNAFARKMGNHAVIGFNRQLVAGYMAPTKDNNWAATLGKVGIDTLSRSDLALTLNMRALSPIAQPMVAGMIAELKKSLNGGPGQVGGLDKPTIALLKAAAEGGQASADALFRDTEALVLGIDIDNYGVGLSATMQFKQGSQMAKVFTDGKGVSDVLNRLPLGTYVSASGSNMNGVNSELMIDEMINRLPKGEKHWLIDLLKVSMPLTKLTKSTASASYMAGAGGLGGGATAGVTIIRTTDGKAYVKAYRESLAAYNKVRIPIPAELMNMFNPGAAPGGVPAPAAPRAGGGAAPRRANAKPKTPELTFTTTYNAGAVKLGDVSIDQYSVVTHIPAELMAGPAGMAMGMFAATATHGYVARVGDDIIMTTVLDVVLLKSTLAMLKDPKGLGLDPDIQKTARMQMPTHTVTENYWNVTPVLKMMAMFAPPPQGQPLPVKLPPIAMATAVEKSGVVVRIYLPTSVIVSVKNTAMGMMNLFQPGAVPGGGLPIPGLPQAPKNAPRRAP